MWVSEHSMTAFTYLDPACIKIDGNNHRDRLAFVANYARLILYYDKNNQQRGNWQAFFLKEPAILLAAISKTNYSVYHQEYTELEGSLVQFPSETTQISCANQLCRLLKELFCILNQWMHFMQQGTSPYSLRTFLVNKIEGSPVEGGLAAQLAILIASQSLLSGMTRGQVVAPDQGVFESFEPVWFSQHAGITGLYSSDDSGNTVKPSVVTLLAQLRSMYFIVFDVFVQVIGNANNAFQQQHTQRAVFPDTALLMVFSSLLQTQQDQINLYAQQHLDFYYQQVLRQQLLPAQPDQAIVCLRLSSSTPSFSLPAGTAFKAGSYADKSDILFCNQTAVEFNQVVLGEVLTLHYGAASQSASTQSTSSSNTSKNLYVNSIANAAQVQRNSLQEVISWPAFGDSQGLQSQQGFALASPMLYLASGQRTITVTFTRQDQSIIPADYFLDSKCYLSTDTGWLLLTPVTGSSSEDEAATVPPVFVTNVQNTATQPVSSAYSIQIQLQVSDPAIIPFAPGKGPDGYTSHWPILKILLGASSSLISPPQICSISIGVNVTEFDQFTLANDISSLPSKGVQYMLGPQPELGSHFYVGSNECFAKPLSTLILSINWDNLPVDFSNYYAPYNQYLATLPVANPPLVLPQFTNTSFAGNWALLNQNSWTAGTQDVSQNALTLFQQNTSVSPTSTSTSAPTSVPTTNTGGTSDQTSTSSGVTNTGDDTTKTNLPSSVFTFSAPATFIPVPELVLNTLPPITQAKNGYLRFELTAPTYAFGQSLYAALVSYINLCNAQVLIGLAKAPESDSNTPATPAAPGTSPGTKTSNAPLSGTQKLAEDAVSVLGAVNPEISMAAPLIDDVITDAPGLLAKVKSGLKNTASKIGQGVSKAWSGIKSLVGGGRSSTPTVTAATTTEPTTTDTTTTSSASQAPVLATGLQLAPNLPYSPRLVSMQGSSYTALASSVLAQDSASQSNPYPLELYHYGSFVPYLAYDATASAATTGFANLLPQHLDQAGNTMPLFPGVSGEGCLYVALQGVSAPCTVNLYLEVSADGQQALLDADSVAYFYWSNTPTIVGGNAGWQPLVILQNGTNNLNCSGILQLSIPEITVPLTAAQQQLPSDQQVQLEQASTQTYWVSPVMPTSDFWIAIATCTPDINLKISYINTQAVSLTRSTMTGLAVGETPKIAANSITATLNKVSQLATVTQPFSSYGGSATEDDSSYSGSTSFYQRVSERLNHKDRAWNNSDYVRMTYAACSELFYAKVLAGNNGEVQIGVVKAYEDATDPNAFYPSLSPCGQEAILQSLAGKVSAMVGLSLFNLKHQVVTMSINLVIDAQVNQTTLRTQLNQQLKIFLSPWIQSNSAQVSINQGIQQAELINFLLEQPGVIAIASLLISLSNTAGGASITSQTFPVCADADDAILVTASEHQISFGSPGGTAVLTTPTPVVVPVVPTTATPTTSTESTTSTASTSSISTHSSEEKEPKDSVEPTTPTTSSTPITSSVPTAAPSTGSGTSQMVMSNNGLQLLTQWEGCSATMYEDTAGNPTIGVGHCLTSTEQTSHTLIINGVDVPWPNGLSQPQITDLLAQDLVPVQNTINKDVKVPLNQNQFDALCSFTFNVGTGAFASSTLLVVLNEGEYDQVPTQLMRWDKDSEGNVVPGLENRRENEVALWNTPVVTGNA